MECRGRVPCSQALHIRRIVNDQTRLENHLNNMVIDFRNSDYPLLLITNIINNNIPDININTTNVDNNNSSIKVVSTVSELVPLKLNYTHILWQVTEELIIF